MNKIWWTMIKQISWFCVPCSHAYVQSALKKVLNMLHVLKTSIFATASLSSKLLHYSVGFGASYFRSPASFHSICWFRLCNSAMSSSFPDLLEIILRLVSATAIKGFTLYAAFLVQIETLNWSEHSEFGSLMKHQSSKLLRIILEPSKSLSRPCSL